MRLIPFSVLGALLLSGFAAQAAPPPAGVFDWIDSLAAIGFSRVGEVDLARFRSQAARTEFREIPLDPYLRPASTDERTGATYVFDRGEVAVNSHERSGWNEALYSLLALHEVLGANGYPDFQYEITSLFYALRVTEPATRAALTDPSSGIALRATRSAFHPETARFLRGGGGDGVLGGGDADGLALKLALIDGLVCNRDPGIRSSVAILNRIVWLRVVRAEEPIAGGVRLANESDPDSLMGALGARSTLTWNDRTLTDEARTSVRAIGRCSDWKAGHLRGFIRAFFPERL